MRSIYSLLVVGLGSFAFAQPQNLPSLPADVPAAPGVSIVRFDPAQLGLKRFENRWQLWAGNQLLRDLGIGEREAREALNVVRDQHFSQYGSIPGSIPPFEFWLNDADGIKNGFGAKNFIPFNQTTLKVDQVVGAWVIRDQNQLLYNFGIHHDEALQAFGVLKKYGFNQLGFIGVPKPAMTYLLVDPHVHSEPLRDTSDMKEMFGKLNDQGLILPAVGYIGYRVPIDCRKLEVTRLKNEWLIVHGKDVLARFSNNSSPAREGLRLLQECRVTEICFVGKSGFPVFLCEGAAPKNGALGFNNIRIQPMQLKVQAINDVWCITEGSRIHFEFGENRADADVVLKVIQHYQFDQICPVGEANRGGFRLLARTR